MTNAIGIIQAAYRQANLDQVPTTFSTTQEFPYNIGLDLINTVIAEMNRMGRFWFAQASQALTYTAGNNTYNLNTMASVVIDPKDVMRIRREASGFQGELIEMNYRAFQRAFRVATVPTQMPLRWAKYDNIIYLDSTPDQDYSLVLYYFQDIPLVVNTTDTLIVPLKDEDIVREGVYAYLAERIGRPDYAQAYQVYRSKVSAILADMKQDSGLPQQMPANF